MSPARDSFRGDTSILSQRSQEVFHKETPLRKDQMSDWGQMSEVYYCSEGLLFGTFRQASSSITVQFESCHAGARESKGGRRAQLVTNVGAFSGTREPF